ncbi:response regulator [Larkinella insperata]|uniref:Response regulator n=1 Tax=Larkinella insperata TaxID=332158 RepID=A0ABW3Q8I4_9BACT|nr:response regulator [Larkinella insperata]
MNPHHKAEPQAPEHAGKILVIEDSLDQWTLFKKALEEVNPQIKPVLANKPQVAFDLLEECQQTGSGFPLLIVLDLYVPKRQDGWQALEVIHSMPASISQIPVIMFTSSTDLEDLIDAYQQGVQSYVIKPKTVSEWMDCCRILSDYWWQAVKRSRTNPH